MYSIKENTLWAFMNAIQLNITNLSIVSTENFTVTFDNNNILTLEN